MKTIRPNYAEGSFYSNNNSELKTLFDKAVKSEHYNICYEWGKYPIIGGVVPHAGHIYCVNEAVHFFEIVRRSGQIFDVVIIVNPNHTGKGLSLSIDEHDVWESPMGISPIDKQLAALTHLPQDTLSQMWEHSGEVLLPYIHYFLSNEMPILPVSFGCQSNFNAQELSRKLFDACSQLERRPLILASSDFTHFDTPEHGAELDSYALEALLAKDAAEFEQRVDSKQISICGYGAILTLLHFAEYSGRFNIEVLRRGHSGEVYPSEHVVDYVSLLAIKVG